MPLPSKTASNAQEIVRHCEDQRRKLVLHFDRIRPLLEEIARNCYPVAIESLLRGKALDAKPETAETASDLLDATPIKALRRGAAGFHANLTSPSRQWFRLGADSRPGESTLESVKRALDSATDSVSAIIRKSGAYQQIHTLYVHLLAFGFGCLIVLEDKRKVIRAITLRMGSYALANGPDGRVDRVVRSFDFTSSQLLEEFRDDISEEIRLRAERETDATWTIHNLIEPHLHGELPADTLTPKIDLPGMSYRSIYWMDQRNDASNGILRVSGCKFNPIVAPRMEREHGDVYGIGRGREALPMMKGLQAAVYDSLQLSSTSAESPVIASSDFADQGLNLDRGGINIAGPGIEQPFIKPIFTGSDGIKTCEYVIDKFQGQIKEAFYNDIFTAIQMMEKGSMTAAEVYQRVGESLLMLGPVLSSLDFEFLDPFINAVRQYAQDADMLDIPADMIQEFEGAKIEYISSVHLAQRASELGVLDRFVSFSASMAAAYPAVAANIDPDATLRLYADMLGVREACLNPADKVESSRRNEAAAAGERQNQAASLALAETAAKVGSVPMAGTVAGAMADRGALL